MYLQPLSMITPVGLSLDSSVAAMRAGINGFVELPYRDNAEAPIIGASVPLLDPELRPKARIAALLSHALAEAATALADDAAEEIAVLLCLPEADRPGVGLDSRTLGPIIEDALGRRLDRQRSRIITSGNIAAFEALKHARALLGEGSSNCLIVAADSFIGAGSLLWLEQHLRLLREANSDGVIPGEAAAVVGVSARPLGPCAAVVGVGFGTEAATPLNDESVTGVGLAEAIVEALGQCGKTLAEIDLRLSDVGGEGWAFEELVLAQQRVMRRVRSEQPLWHPADKIGDSGAASGVVQLVLGQAMISSPRSNYHSAVCQASAKSGKRGACVMVTSRKDADQ